MKRLLVLGVALFAILSPTRAGTGFYIWMFHEGDFVQFNNPDDIQIKLYAGNCANATFDWNDNGVVSKKSVAKGGSTTLPLAAGGVYRFTVREGKAGYSTNSDMMVEIPANAFDGLYKHIETDGKDLCGTKVSKSANLPANFRQQ